MLSLVSNDICMSRETYRSTSRLWSPIFRNGAAAVTLAYITHERGVLEGEHKEDSPAYSSPAYFNP